jgi:hypothetical protein
MNWNAQEQTIDELEQKLVKCRKDSANAKVAHNRDVARLNARYEILQKRWKLADEEATMWRLKFADARRWLAHWKARYDEANSAQYDYNAGRKAS